MKSPRIAHKSSPCSLQLEKARASETCHIPPGSSLPTQSLSQQLLEWCKELVFEDLINPQ